MPPFQTSLLTELVVCIFEHLIRCKYNEYLSFLNNWKFKTIAVILPKLEWAFFPFPLKDEKCCKEWSRLMKIKDFTPTAASKLCSDYFSPQCFEQDLAFKGNTWNFHDSRHSRPVGFATQFPQMHLHVNNKNKANTKPLATAKHLVHDALNVFKQNKK